MFWHRQLREIYDESVNIFFEKGVNDFIKWSKNKFDPQISYPMVLGTYAQPTFDFQTV